MCEQFSLRAAGFLFVAMLRCIPNACYNARRSSHVTLEGRCAVCNSDLYFNLAAAGYLHGAPWRVLPVGIFLQILEG